MQKSLIITGIVAAAVFGTGYIVGQLRGPTDSTAASIQLQTQQLVPQAASGPAHFGRHADGTVTAVNGDTVTIKSDAAHGGVTEDESVTTIVLNSSTQYLAGPGQTAGKSAITKGGFIIAEGSLSSDGKTLTASRVAIGPAGGFRGHGFGHGPGFAIGPHADGQVKAINGNTLTIQGDAHHAGVQEDESVTSIQLTSSTTYHADQGVAASKSSIKQGDFIVATGTLSSDGKTLTASDVMIRGSGSVTGSSQVSQPTGNA